MAGRLGTRAPARLDGRGDRGARGARRGLRAQARGQRGATCRRLGALHGAGRRPCGARAGGAVVRLHAAAPGRGAPAAAARGPRGAGRRPGVAPPRAPRTRRSGWRWCSPSRRRTATRCSTCSQRATRSSSPRSTPAARSSSGNGNTTCATRPSSSKAGACPGRDGYSATTTRSRSASSARSSDARADVVVVSGWSTFASQAAIAWCRLRRVPYVLLVESNDRDERPGWRRAVKGGVVPAIVRGAAHVLVVGTLARESMLAWGADPGRIDVFADTIDVGAFGERADALAPRRQELRAEAGLGPDDVAVLSVARLSPEKGLDTLVRVGRRRGRP